MNYSNIFDKKNPNGGGHGELDMTEMTQQH